MVILTTSDVVMHQFVRPAMVIPHEQIFLFSVHRSMEYLLFFPRLCLLGLYLMGLVLSVRGQSIEKNLPLHPWFSVKKVAEKVWCISDYGIDNIYLLVGSDSAMLIDNGVGAADLKNFVQSITRLPLIVVNSHSHPDHTGSNHQFAIVRAHQDVRFRHFKPLSNSPP